MILNSLSWLGRVRRPCLLCRDWSDKPICAACIGDLPWIDPATPVMSLAVGSGRPLPIYAAFHYRYPIDRAIAEFKSGGSGCCLRGLIALAMLRSIERSLTAVDQLLPLPASRGHSKRRWALSIKLAQSLRQGQTVVGRVDWLSGQSQRGRSAWLRKTSDRRFLVRSPEAGPRVGLVDDICTTGASLASLASACRDQGLDAQWAWVLAYTPSPRNMTLRYRG